MSNNTHGPPYPDSFLKNRARDDGRALVSNVAPVATPSLSNKPGSSRDRSAPQPSVKTKLVHDLKKATREWVRHFGYTAKWIANSTKMSVQSAKDLLNASHHWQDGPSPKSLKRWMSIPGLPQKIWEGLRTVAIMNGTPASDIPDRSPSKEASAVDGLVSIATNDLGFGAEVIDGKWPTSCPVGGNREKGAGNDEELRNKPRNLCQ